MTVHIFPKYHVVFDDLFETVYSTGENVTKVDATSNSLFDHKYDCFVFEEYYK